MSVSFTAQWKNGNRTEFGADISINGRNAAVLLDLLGYGEQARQEHGYLGIPSLPDAFGQAGPADFLGRVLVARALLGAAADDEHGLPGVGSGGDGGASFTDLGREPGDLAEKLDALEDVARDAAAHGGIVAWG